MDQGRARELLGLEGEFSGTELKAAFRRNSFLCHPDTVGSNEKFVELQGAYELLKTYTTKGEVSPGDRTVDGTPLSELGKGLPLTVSAKPCEHCSGQGYSSYTNEYDWVQDDCEKCGGSGLLRYPCKYCNGTGDYRHPRTKEVVGHCNACKGGKWFYPYDKRWHQRDLSWSVFKTKYVPGTTRRGIACKSCDGDGKVSRKVQLDGAKFLHRKCDACEGVGEVKIYNPVLPRGFLSTGTK